MKNFRLRAGVLLYALFSLWPAPVAGSILPPDTRGCHEYAVSAATLIQEAKQGFPRFVVDIREERTFREVGIPGALNIPIYAIRTKGFLKDRPVVLVDEGYGGASLEKECSRLEGLGFRVRGVATLC